MRAPIARRVPSSRSQAERRSKGARKLVALGRRTVNSANASVDVAADGPFASAPERVKSNNVANWQSRTNVIAKSPAR